jgi:uncharacterized membrane protein YbaN (DUF454 family)
MKTKKVSVGLTYVGFNASGELLPRVPTKRFLLLYANAADTMPIRIKAPPKS